VSELSNGEQFLVNALADAIGWQRMMYAGRNGNTKRTKLWDEFGYPEQVTFDMLYRAYRRNSAAYAGVHKTLDSCWVDRPTIIEGEEADEAKKTTPWEKLVTALLKKHWAKIKDADRRNLVGRYSALLIQVKDGLDWNQPIDTEAVGRLGVAALVKLIPVWESQIKPGNFDTDSHSETYGQPVDYQFNEQPVGDDGTYGPARSITVHPSRVIVLAEGSEDENILSGIPLNEAGYNDLLDIEKSKGGSAEGFLKNASRQLGIAFDKETSMQALNTEAVKGGYKDIGDALNDKIARMNRGTDAALVMQAGQPSVLSVAPADPTPTWTVSANSYASTIQCPFNILFGKQTGSLASTEDKTAWAGTCNERRQGFLKDLIERVIQRFWEVGIIAQPTSGEVSVTWSDLLSPGDTEKLANMGAMADVAQKTQAALGRSAITENEIRQAGGFEPIPELDVPDPNKPPTGKDPLNDDQSDDPNAGNTP